MDPRLYAALYVLQRAAGPTAEITILSGFRTRKTNDMLRRRGIGAAADSYHMKACAVDFRIGTIRSEEHTSELQSLMRISYAVFCLKKKKQHSHDYIQDSASKIRNN